MEPNSTLEALTKAPPIYFLPDTRLMSLMVPAIAASSSLDCMMGFFASSSFAEIAPGLAAFLRSSNKPMRLLISPFVSGNDQAAMEKGLVEDTKLAENILISSLPDATALAKHTLACLAWLIREKRLHFKVAFMPGGLFHPKVWLLNVEGHRLAFHGSSNMTGAAFLRNKEQLAFVRSWMDEAQFETERLLREEFNSLEQLTADLQIKRSFALDARARGIATGDLIVYVYPTTEFVTAITNDDDADEDSMRRSLERVLHLLTDPVCGRR